jgi:hypothetical protein
MTGGVTGIYGTTATTPNLKFLHLPFDGIRCPTDLLAAEGTPWSGGYFLLFHKFNEWGIIQRNRKKRKKSTGRNYSECPK